MSNNPFRNPVRQEASLSPLPQSPKPPASTPSGSYSQPETATSSSQTPPRSSASRAVENIEDDLPPPYTPSANVGEQTVGLGPRRPFQQPPSLPPPSLHPPDQSSHPIWPPLSPQHPPPSGPGVGPGFYALPDPQGLAPWQTQQQYRRRQQVGGGLLGALFGTVRDIADVVSGAHDGRMLASQDANVAAYAAPYPSTGLTYAPPPGPPGQIHPPPPARPASAPPHSPPPIPDDGSPTRTPVPGHPLLLGDNLLVYPRDYLCVRCKNTGYKNYDPSNPCRKCWEKYGRPYTGALAYTPWSPFQNDPRMQRPLPKFVPPHHAGPSPGPASGPCHVPQPSYDPYPPPPRHPQHNRSISQPHHTHSQESGPSYYVMNPLSPWSGPPVPHAIPVNPGDPRLGGRLCMRCGGAGTRTMMLFDVSTCDNCGGTGRVWT